MPTINTSQPVSTYPSTGTRPTDKDAALERAASAEEPVEIPKTAKKGRVVTNPEMDMDVHYTVGRNRGSDRVTISVRAREMAAIVAAVDKLPDMRTGKPLRHRPEADEEDNYESPVRVNGKKLDEI